MILFRCGRARRARRARRALRGERFQKHMFLVARTLLSVQHNNHTSGSSVLGPCERVPTHIWARGGRRLRPRVRGNELRRVRAEAGRGPQCRRTGAGVF